MFKDYKILLLLALVGFVLVGISVKDSFDQDYVKHQKDYYKRIGEKEYTVEIKQVNLETAGITMVDRCQSCHIGASNPEAIDFPQPLTYHPPIVPGLEEDPHDFNKMGCAICHDGNSRALEFHDAHGEFHGWPQSYALLPDKTAQANCFRCHAQEGGSLAGAEHFEDGRSLYLEKACWGCHAIDGVSNAKQAPELTNAGGKHSFDYLYESIQYPKANDENSKMPKFDWVYEHETVSAIATYLKGQQVSKIRSANNTPIGYVKPASIENRITEPSIEAGRALFAGVEYKGSTSRGGCINCHAWRNEDGDIAGGHIGPELTWSVRNRGKEYVRDHIINSRMHAPDSIMPSFKEYNDAELDSLVMYLSSFTYKLDLEQVEEL
jgi:mono/diheme cytochrome c family protein|tara:strand:- start:26 stop:1162 length:1137 start_codon:yes stop_codon:yes gene_type:complete